ncbi:MAG: 2-dehydropantoate 2-reductase [Verrucomicrobiales bacterium]
MTDAWGAKEFRIAIVGAGAVGCYYGSRLAANGHDVHFLMRSDYAHVRDHGLCVKSRDGNFHLDNVNCYRTPAEIGPCDLVIVAIKATANGALKTLLPPLLKPGTMILTLQNGLGNESFLSEHFGAERILGGLCFVCINRTAPGVIEHTAQGLISLGEYQRSPMTRTHKVQQMLVESGIPSQVVSDLALERWRKLVWNIPFNGLSIAAGGVDVSEILRDPGLLQLARGLMQEVIDLAVRLECPIPADFIDENIERTRGMGPYQPSSLIDFLAGRAVEVEAIWGESLRLAVANGLNCGRLEALYFLVKAVSGRNCRS